MRRRIDPLIVFAWVLVLVCCALFWLAVFWLGVMFG